MYIVSIDINGLSMNAWVSDAVKQELVWSIHEHPQIVHGWVSCCTGPY